MARKDRREDDDEQEKEVVDFEMEEGDGERREEEDPQELAKAEEERENARLRRKKLEAQQALANCLQREKLVDALVMALDLAQPHQCLSIVERILEREDHHSLMTCCFVMLNPVQLSALLDYAAQWNVNTRTYHVSQLLLNYALQCVPMPELTRVPMIREWMEARVANLQKLLQLQGKLELIVEQMAVRSRPVLFAPQEPMMVFDAGDRDNEETESEAGDEEEEEEEEEEEVEEGEIDVI